MKTETINKVKAYFFYTLLTIIMLMASACSKESAERCGTCFSYEENWSEYLDMWVPEDPSDEFQECSTEMLNRVEQISDTKRITYICVLND